MNLDHRSPVWHPFTQHGLGEPIPLIDRAQGARLYDSDGNSWIDAISSWWVTTHGHAPVSYTHLDVYKRQIVTPDLIRGPFRTSPETERRMDAGSSPA